MAAMSDQAKQQDQAEDTAEPTAQAEEPQSPPAGDETASTTAAADEQAQQAEFSEQAQPAEQPEDEPRGKSKQPDDRDEVTIQRQVEAVLMSVERPITAGKIAEALELDATKPIRQAIKQLNGFYDEHGLSFRIEEVAGGFQILTRPEHKEVVAALHRTKADNRLSAAALETLAVIAYKQPIMRAEIETVRGVACGEVIRSLMDKHLIKIVGRAEEIGRPMLYGTTKTFLRVFGLSNLKDLPKAEELQKP